MSRARYNFLTDETEPRRSYLRKNNSNDAYRLFEVSFTELETTTQASRHSRSRKCRSPLQEVNFQLTFSVLLLSNVPSRFQHPIVAFFISPLRNSTNSRYVNFFLRLFGDIDVEKEIERGDTTCLAINDVEKSSTSSSCNRNSIFYNVYSI